MFAGHYALGLACHAQQPLDPRARPGVLLFFVAGAQLNDVLWTLFTLVGVEGGWSMGTMAEHEPVLPWSHALVMHVVYAVVVGVVGAAVFDRGVGVWGAVNVLLHYGADLAVEDMPLRPGSGDLVHGLALYDRGFAWWFGVEAVVVVVCCALARWRLDTRVQTPRFVWRTVVALLALHAALALPTLLQLPARDLAAAPWAALGYTLPLLVGVAVTTGLWGRALAPPPAAPLKAL